VVEKEKKLDQFGDNLMLTLPEKLLVLVVVEDYLTPNV
jgi:hypothetical protein